MDRIRSSFPLALRLSQGLSVCVLVTLALTGASHAASGEPAIAPSVAALYAGEEKVIEGTVASTQREGNVVQLRLGPRPTDLTVSLVIGMLSTFPPEPEHYYAGKAVRVRGTIQSFRGTPEIVIHDSAALQLVGTAPAVAAQPVAAQPVAATRSADESCEQRIETLQDRVRQLEDKIQQLEPRVPAADTQ